MAQDVQQEGNFKHHSPLTATHRLQVSLILSLVPGLGVSKADKLCKHFNLTLEQLISLSAADLKHCGLNPRQIAAINQPNNQQLDCANEWLAKSPQHFIVDLNHPAYPSRLKEISSPPFALFGKGDVDMLASDQIAVVGSRKPTYNGKHIAHSLSADLGALGLTVTSGLALGIDACAHQGAISKRGITIAVLGSGLERVYPRRNYALSQQIIEQKGVIISEFFPDTPPNAQHFPRRNRIVSGISLGVVIVEAAIKSGSLITARLALEQNREVFAVPGSVLNPNAKGCHFLIKQGAKLVESVEDICEEFQNVNSFKGQTPAMPEQKSPAQSLASKELLDSVDYDMTALDVILRRSGLPIEEVLAQLLDFELRGLVASVSGGYVKLRGK